MGIWPMASSRAGRRRRHAFCTLRGKNRAGASVALPQTQGSAPYRSLHPGLLCAAAFGAWQMFRSLDAGLIGQRRRAHGSFRLRAFARWRLKDPSAPRLVVI